MEAGYNSTIRWVESRKSNLCISSLLFYLPAILIKIYLRKEKCLNTSQWPGFNYFYLIFISLNPNV